VEDLELLERQLEPSRARSSRGRSAHGERRFERDAVAPLEQVGGNVLDERDALEQPGTVPHDQEADLARGSALVQPPAHEHPLAHVVLELLDVDEIPRGTSLLLGLFLPVLHSVRDDLLLDVRGRFLVVIELHVVQTAVGGERLQGRRVGQHLRQRNLRLDHLGVSWTSIPAASRAARRDRHDVTMHSSGAVISTAMIGSRIVGPPSPSRLEREGSGDLEGDLGGVDGVIRPVDEDDPEIDDRKAGEPARAADSTTPF